MAPHLHRRTLRHALATATLATLLASTSHAGVDSQSHASSDKLWAPCSTTSSGTGYGVGWPIGSGWSALNGTRYTFCKHSITDFKLGTVRSEIVSYAYPTPAGCEESRVTFLRSISFRVFDAAEPFDIAWLGTAQLDPRGFARWSLKQTDAADLVVAGLTIPASPATPRPEGVMPPDPAIDGRMRFLLPPGSYRLEMYAECRSTDVRLRTLISFDTDRDGLSDFAEDCPTDLDGNGDTNFADVSLLLMEMGDSGSMSDQDGSGTVDLSDLALLLQGLGPCPAAW